jgi:hypothetical protein
MITEHLPHGTRRKPIFETHDRVVNPTTPRGRGSSDGKLRTRLMSGGSCSTVDLLRVPLCTGNFSRLSFGGVETHNRESNSTSSGEEASRDERVHTSTRLIRSYSRDQLQMGQYPGSPLLEKWNGSRFTSVLCHHGDY